MSTVTCELRSTMRASARGRAFTLIELLVAITITLIMLAIINQIMYTTTEAVSMGAATSDMIGAARTINAQFAEDAAAMIPPSSSASPAGLLVIYNNIVASVPVTTDSGEVTRDRVRDDQLLFIVDAAGTEPFCPDHWNTYKNEYPGPYARVWYGHLRRTGNTGGDFIDANNNGIQEGSEVAVGDLGPGDASGMNLIASDWLLGRQAIHLRGPGSPPEIALDESISSNAYGWNAPVAGYGSATLISYLDTTARKRAYSGLSDVSRWKLVGDSSTPNGMISTDPSWTTYPLFSGQSGTDYRTNAMRFLYLPTGQRLRCNPTPKYVPGTASFSEFGTYQIAQMHPFLAGHISDFIVEFAGDYENNTTGSVGSDGQIDVVRDSEDTGGSNFPLNTAGSIKWYGRYDQKAWGVTIPPTSIFDRTGSGTPAPIWLNSPNDDVFVFRHDTPAALWPHLLRIRYRIHDQKGRLGDRSNRDPAATNDPGSGRWEEVIVPVRRTNS